MKNIYIDGYRKDFRQLMAEASTVVVSGGYNSLMEAIAGKKNIVTITQSLPDAKNGGETAFRAEHFAAAGFIHTLSEVDLSDNNKVYQKIFNSSPIQATSLETIKTDGADIMTKQILSLLA